MIHYKTILDAIQRLENAGCTRDQRRGLWLDSSGRELASDPLTAIRELRRLTLAQAMEEQRQSGRHWTREHVPDATR